MGESSRNSGRFESAKEAMDFANRCGLSVMSLDAKDQRVITKPACF